MSWHLHVECDSGASSNCCPVAYSALSERRSDALAAAAREAGYVSVRSTKSLAPFLGNVPSPNIGSHVQLCGACWSHFQSSTQVDQQAPATPWTEKGRRP